MPVVSIGVFEASGPQTVFPEPAVEGERRCMTHCPGHGVHYIQARKAREHHGDGASCEMVELVEPAVVVLAVGRSRRRWHNHALARIREALDAIGQRAPLRGREPHPPGEPLLLHRHTRDWLPDCDTAPATPAACEPSPDRRGRHKAGAVVPRKGERLEVAGGVAGIIEDVDEHGVLLRTGSGALVRARYGERVQHNGRTGTLKGPAD